MDGGAWKAAVHGVAKSRTWLSDFTFTFHFHALEKEMATHSSVLAGRVPGTAEPGGLPSMGSHRVTQLKRLSSSSRGSSVGGPGVPGAAALGSRVAMGCFRGWALLCVSWAHSTSGLSWWRERRKSTWSYQLIVFQRLDQCFYLFPCIQPFVSAELQLPLSTISRHVRLNS